MKSVLVLFAHPAFERSRINRRLISALSDLDNVQVRDLYEIYPDFQIDVPSEQQSLRDHDVIVLHHPFYWYSAPALLKEWEDLVLEHGFAYGQGGDALRGKWLLSVVTTGGSQSAYLAEGINRHSVVEFLLPFRQTAELCGMTYLPPFVVNGTHQLVTEAQIAPHAAAYRNLLAGIRDEQVSPESLSGYDTLHCGSLAQDGVLDGETD